ncbi:MAG: hypothetical protein JST42_30065 [Bacteroidetes bacterium]|nr:hypothetical protein [Bacteroidota bacterium]
MKTILLTLALTIAACQFIFAQAGLYRGSLEGQGILTGSRNVPFWMRSDQYGSVPLAGASGSLIARGEKVYDSSYMGLSDWGGAIEVRGDLGNGSRLTLIEGYLKARFSIFQIKAGRSREIMGLVDSTLSSGAFSISGNALGIPKIEVSIPNYFTLPVLDGLIALKGSFAHGWVGKQEVIPNYLVREANTYYHETSLYGRIGRPDWKLHLYGGINHEVYWGNEPEFEGKKRWQLSTMQTFKYVLLGKTYKGSKVGNHIGSIDMALEYDFGQVKLMAYRQNFFDEGAIAKLANVMDGLQGISLVNADEEPDYYPVQHHNSSSYSAFHWHKIVLEVFASKNQAGYPWSRPTKSGDENYYNNNTYPLGWSYMGMGLGNPFVTPYTTTRTDLPNDTTDFFNNNRVIALYGGIEGSVGDYRFVARGSYSMNYGTFGTSPWGHSTGNHFYPPKYGLFPKVNQLSGWLSVERDLDERWTAGVVLAFDKGMLFYDSPGIIFRLKRNLY